MNVSALSFGASSLGSVFRDTDEQESIRAVHTALELGINYIDVAPYYGLTKAETVLGKAIKELDRSKFFLSSKAGRYGEADFKFTEQKIMASVDESLARLQTDYLDILFLHDIEFVPADIIMQEAIPALEKLKKQGKIRYSGISGLPLQLFKHFLPQIDVDCILSYCHYSLNDRSLLSLLPLIEEHQVGLVNASPLSMGLLSTRTAPAWHPASESIKKQCELAANYCTTNGADIAKLAIQYSCSNPTIPTTLVSTANPENIAKNIKWVEEEMDQELVEDVLTILKPIDGMSWSSGLPEYNTELNLKEQANKGVNQV